MLRSLDDLSNGKNADAGAFKDALTKVADDKQRVDIASRIFNDKVNNL